MAASPGARSYPVSVSPTRSGRSGPPGSVHNPLFLRSSSPDVPLASTSRNGVVARDKRYIDIIRGPPAAISQTIPRVTRPPPSAIPQDIPRRRTRKVPSASQPYPAGLLGNHALAANDRQARQLARREARIASETEAQQLRAMRTRAGPHVVLPRIRIRPPPPPPDPGHRKERDQDLTAESLLLNGVRPPTLTTTRTHQSCGICLHIKYRCGHSHCYRCIRVWLEKKWTCPTCRDVMHVAPYRHYGEEDGLALDHPTFVDRSVVDYSWDGLTFPKPPKVRVPIELDL
ncbi:hypothetical protein C8R47DRAFT_1211933 [Mycena vitilis]|nr:hypothetical protein C8R47DRAFT_1211916 [Mycena vitilis]KAJ6499638.1 hypothetical protein C8R47DRAFT_1211933 [Mycena vitilis]